jgi:mannose-6-phosphate isomerase-like protein (cupin superfamily)
MANRQTVNLDDAILVKAPDGSDIRLLPAVDAASMVHCSLPPGAVTKAIYHRTVEEIWYCLSGLGALWRSDTEGNEPVVLKPGVAANIPLGARFQFRNDGQSRLEILIVTSPPWPESIGSGDSDDSEPGETVLCNGPWQPTL